MTSGDDDFEKGAYDWYRYTAPNLGKLAAVCIEHENSGEKYGWYLEEILVESDEGGSWFFPFGQWLADDDQSGNRLRPQMVAGGLKIYPEIYLSIDTGIEEVEYTVFMHPLCARGGHSFSWRIAL